jgi:accessory gene regulator protein AgrB
MEMLNKIKQTMGIGLMLLFLIMSFWTKDIMTERMLISLSFVFLIVALRPITINKQSRKNEF